MPYSQSSNKTPKANKPKPSRLKPNIGADTLKAHGIEYDPTILLSQGHSEAPNEIFPEGVNGVKERLLASSASLLPKHWKDFMDHQFEQAKKEDAFADKTMRDSWSLVPPVSALWDPLYPNSRDRARLEVIIKDIENCRILADDAKRLRTATEADWTFFLRKNIFRQFGSNARDLREYDHSYGEWCLEENVYWNSHAGTPNDDDDQRLTGPKPDLTYGFPIFPPTHNFPLALSSANHAQSFRAATIRRLHGPPWELKASLTTKIYQKDNTELHNPDLVCFPWAVVEVKRKSAEKDVRDFCYRQAANASATALGIMTRLFQDPKSPVPADLPPIIAFTCNGPELRLWLMFWAQQNGQRVKRMVCIWATDLELTWGIFAARSLVNAMTEWTIDELKQRIGYRLKDIIGRSLFPHRDHRAATSDDERESSYRPMNMSEETSDSQAIPSEPVSRDTPIKGSSSNARNLPREQKSPDSVRDDSAPICASAKDTWKVSPPGQTKTHSSGGGTKVSCNLFPNEPQPAVSEKSSWKFVPIHTSSASESPANEETRSPGTKKSPWKFIPIHTSSANESPAKEENRSPGTGQANCLPFATSSKPWTRIIPIRDSFLHTPTPTPKSAQHIAGHKLPTGPVSHVPASDASTSSGLESIFPLSPVSDIASSVQLFWENQDFAETRQERPKSIYRKEPPLHGGPEVLQGAPGSNDSTSSGPSAAQSHNKDTPNSEANGKDQGIFCQGGESISLRSESPSFSAAELKCVKPEIFRYHVYRVRRTISLSWAKDLCERASVDDSSVNSSDSEYFPSEGWNTDAETEFDDGSDQDQESDWEDQSESASSEDRDAGSESWSQYNWRDGGMHDESECGSSEFWDSDKYDSPYSEDSEDDEGSIDGSSSASSLGEGPTNHPRPTHGHFLKGPDVDSLRKKAWSMIPGYAVAELPRMQALIETMNDGRMNALMLHFWRHCRFDPEAGHGRDILIRDLRACFAQRQADGDDVPRVAEADLTFDDLRRLSMEGSLGFPAEHDDMGLRNRICRNLMRLTKAPYCEAVLRYSGLLDYSELWVELGDELLQSIHDGKCFDIPEAKRDFS